MKNLFYLFILFILFYSNITAQVNTEKLRKELDETGIFGNVSLAGSITSGNSEFVSVKAGMRIDYANESNDLFLVSSYEFKEGNESKIVNKGFAHLRNVLSLTPDLFLEIFIQKEFNEFILLKDRNLAGSGLRLDLTGLLGGETETDLKIYFSPGLMFENEKYKTEPQLKTDIFRSTNYLTLNWRVNEVINFISISYFQFDVERIKDHRFITDAGLNFSITENLVFTSAVVYRYDNEPVENVKNFDFELSNGIIFSF
jgi:putative salt-induced outer membrane protein YdiY